MVDFSRKHDLTRRFKNTTESAYLWWLEWVIAGKVNGQEEDSSAVGALRLARISAMDFADLRVP